jgi:hypothetical protein
MDTTAIVGFSLFALSEVLAVLPIPANGFLQSLMIGLRNSLNKKRNDIEMAHTMIGDKPEVACVVNQVATSKPLAEALASLASNPHIIPQVEALCKNSTLTYIITVLENNPQLLASIAQTLEHSMSNTEIRVGSDPSSTV